MKNVVKLFSHNKDSRVVITHAGGCCSLNLASKESEHFLKETLTSCILFAGLNDFNTKTSFTLRITRDLSVYCLVQEAQVQLTFSPTFDDKRIKPKEHFTRKSTLSVTIGDFSGMHTSTISAVASTFSEILNFFSKQSEQLPTRFLIHESNPLLGAVIQPLPFADLDSVNVLSHTVVEQLDAINATSWGNQPDTFGGIGTILWDKQVNKCQRIY